MVGRLVRAISAKRFLYASRVAGLPIFRPIPDHRPAAADEPDLRRLFGADRRAICDLSMDGRVFERAAGPALLSIRRIGSSAWKEAPCGWCGAGSAADFQSDVHAERHVRLDQIVCGIFRTAGFVVLRARMDEKQPQPDRRRICFRHRGKSCAFVRRGLAGGDDRALPAGRLVAPGGTMEGIGVYRDDLCGSPGELVRMGDRDVRREDGVAVSSRRAVSGIKQRAHAQPNPNQHRFDDCSLFPARRLTAIFGKKTCWAASATSHFTCIRPTRFLRWAASGLLLCCAGWSRDRRRGDDGRRGCECFGSQSYFSSRRWDCASCRCRSLGARRI